MIRLATVIDTFEADLLAHFRGRLRPEHYHALAAMKQCRTQASPIAPAPIFLDTNLGLNRV
jgi:hypothetical protein